jgi:protein-disulfide isomerase
VGIEKNLSIAVLEMHDRLYSAQPRLDESSLREHARELRLELSAFGSCMEQQTPLQLAQHIALGKKLGVRVTPTVFIGLVQVDGRVRILKVIEGAVPLAEFEAALDQAMTVQ